jgi:hypothetical protein
MCKCMHVHVLGNGGGDQVVDCTGMSKFLCKATQS